MPKLLRLDASSRTKDSHSRKLADQVQARWEKLNPGGKVIVRDLSTSQIPHISEATITGFYSPPENHTPEIKKALEWSNTLLAELLPADTILISLPIYNFTVPSSLKAYIDQIVRPGHTFKYDPATGFAGLLKGKKIYVTTAYGAGDFHGGPLTALDFVEPYLKVLFNFLAVTDIRFFFVEGTNLDPALKTKTYEAAIRAIEASTF